MKNRIPICILCTAIALAFMLAGCVVQRADDDSTTDETYVIYGGREDVINRPAFYYDGELYQNSFVETFSDLPANFTFVGVIAKNDPQRVPTEQLISCGVSEGAKIYMHNDMQSAMVSEIWKDGSEHYRLYGLCDDDDRSHLEREEKRVKKYLEQSENAETEN